MKGAGRPSRLSGCRCGALEAVEAWAMSSTGRGDYGVVLPKRFLP